MGFGVGTPKLDLENINSDANPATTDVFDLGSADKKWKSCRISQDLSVGGNLTIEGDTTLIESTTLRVEDKNIELAFTDSPTDLLADGGGITLKGDTDKTILWNDATNSWDFNQGIRIADSVDGVFTGLVIENSQANVAGSTNETAELRFGFGGNGDVARIIAGKENDYTAAANEDSFLAFYTDLDGIDSEKMRIGSDGAMLLTGTNKKIGATDAGSLYLAPFIDSTTAFQIREADDTEIVFNVDTLNGRIGIENATGTGPQYRLDVGADSYFAINGNFAHTVQHNSAASTFWSIAPRNGGDLDIAVTTTDPRPTSGTIGTSDNAISIKADKDVEFLGDANAKDGFGVELFNVSTSVFETAVAGNEYNSPNQHGGIFGAIFRRYYAIPDAQGTGDTIEIAMGFTLTGRIVEISGVALNQDSNIWQTMPFVDFGSSARNLELQVNSNTSKIRLIGGSGQDWQAGGFICLDYTK